MARVLVHRGPDDEGYYIDPKSGRSGFAHRRLSIIDLATGQQPLSNEDGSVWVIFNGEIYNFQELRSQLEQKGHIFKTQSDTEVIVHQYEEDGPECLQKFRGMFAFAIWDEKKELLFLARDRLGQKPLFYLKEPGRFLFASEIKAILQLPQVPRKVKKEALHHYLTYQYVPHPMTMFEGVEKIPPAHYLILKGGQMEVKRYWQPDFSREEHLSENEWCERIVDTLTEATRLRLIADVPLGAYLSGGIDSSITVGLMTKLSSEAVRTFSIGFEERAYDELSYARIVARHFNTQHEEFVVRPRCLEILSQLIWHYDEPFADSSAIPTYYVALMTSRRVKVALTGDAGDECFAGYPRYKAVNLASYFDRLPGVLRRIAGWRFWQSLPASVEQKSVRRRAKRLLSALNEPPEMRYLRWICIFDNAAKDALYTRDFAQEVTGLASSYFLQEAYEKSAGRDFISRTTFVDLLTYLPCDLLAKVDIASMAHSLEPRSPFLDHKVVELATSIPSRLKLKGWGGKYILKKAFKDLLPKEILARGKMGFGVPIAEWFRGELKDFVKEVLLSSRACARGYFREEAVRALIQQHIDGQFDHGYRLWALLNLELWHDRFIDQLPQP
jgi:asparagine synthase (glutamine-hydrolysing)